MTPRAFFPALSFALAVAPTVAGADARVELPAAGTDRAAQVITLPAPVAANSVRSARDGRGRVLPVQVDAHGTARVVVPWQPAREPLTLTLSADAPPAGHVKVAVANGLLTVSTANSPAFVYRMDREQLPRPDIKPVLKRAGYIHPIYSPSGKIVTDDYPANHAWHHGIWTPWVKTSFQGREPDFWNMEKQTGTHDFVALDRTWEGPVHGGFAARHRMVDLSAPAPLDVLHETWEVTAYDYRPQHGPAARVFDLVFTQRGVTDSPLVLPKFHYGGFGFRGANEWNGPGDAATFLTSEGVSDRKAGDSQRARWCYVGGKLDGQPTGTLILGHPGNFRAPQPARLHPTFPYMSFVPQALGEFAIEPGKPYVARFRFVVLDGAPDRALFDAFWDGYAHPAQPAAGGGRSR